MVLVYPVQSRDGSARKKKRKKVLPGEGGGSEWEVGHLFLLKTGRKTDIEESGEEKKREKIMGGKEGGT